MNKIYLISLLSLGMFFTPLSLANRENITIVGSSTVFPFSKVVAERFGRSSRFKSPRVEPTGTGGGFKEFCRGLGISTPDIANASRKMKPSEFKSCQKNGVNEIIEIHIGYDGIVVANAIEAKPLALNLKDIFLALAKEIPDPHQPEKLIPNPYQKWSDINPSLPEIAITVFGPPATSGTRDAFSALVIEEGCLQYDWIAQLQRTDETRFNTICHAVREDGKFIDAGENDNLVVRKLNQNTEALGIFGFSFLDQNADKVQAVTINNQQPTFESISNGKYGVSRPLYFYVKKAHLQMKAGVREFLNEFVSDEAIGESGYLTEKGLIPLVQKERDEMKNRISMLKTYSPQ